MKYQELRDALKRIENSDHPDVISAYRWHSSPDTLRALLADADRADALEQARDRFSRMFLEACVDLDFINEALGLEPDDGGAEPILQAIAEIKAERDALKDALTQSDALVAAHTRPGDEIADAVRAAARAALSQGEQNGINQV